MSRRSVLRLLGIGSAAALAAACSPSAPASPTAKPAAAASPAAAGSPSAAASPAAKPAASPAASAASGISKADWDQIVAGAKSEGALSLATYAGTGYRVIVEAFEKAYPGIKVEHSQFQSSSRDYLPRLLQEQKAGLYTWDVAIMTTQEMLRQAVPIGAAVPIRPLLVLPEVLDDSVWIDGFEGGFTDNGKQWQYSIGRDIESQIWINTDQVKDGEITKLDDLLDPKWRGKMVGGDPRSKGSGFTPTTMMRVVTGSDDIVKKLWVDQEVVVGTDARQLTEFMVRGRYPLGVGAVDRRILADFQAQGLGMNIKVNPIPEIEYTNAGSNNLWIVAKAPHPKAAQVFVNWVLTKEGSSVYAPNASINSRRLDVPAVDEAVRPVKGVKYLRSDDESLLEPGIKTQEMAKALLN